jgi:hypothetical protein
MPAHVHASHTHTHMYIYATSVACSVVEITRMRMCAARVWRALLWKSRHAYAVYLYVYMYANICVYACINTCVEYFLVRSVCIGMRI